MEFPNTRYQVPEAIQEGLSQMNLKSMILTDSVLREVGIMRMLSHPNIVRCHDVISAPGMIYLVQDSRQMTLENSLSTNPCQLAKAPQIMHQILQGLSHFHGRGVIHRDLRPCNIFLKQDESVSIGGFHLARVVQGNSPVTPIVQTILYRAPEVLLGESYSKAIDIWSAGCILAEMALGKPLFNGTSEYDQIVMICALLGVPNEHSWYGISKSPNYSVLEGLSQHSSLDTIIENSMLLDLLKQMLTLCPKQRPTAIECLRHPFFQ